jgi:molybdopterin-guanine dinucleotide biosynthesis protein A
MTGLILAGGAGRQMGGVDKGLQPFKGQPLVAWSVRRLAPQVGEILLSANQNLDRYAGFGLRIVPDQLENLAGPLAGLHSGLAAARGEMVATVPCDCPFFPTDLVTRLAVPLRDERVDASFARTGQRTHPVFCIVRRRLLPALKDFLEAGGRKVEAWFGTLNAQAVAFDDDAGAFVNLNTLEELRAAESAADPAERSGIQGLPEG